MAFFMDFFSFTIFLGRRGGGGVWFISLMPVAHSIYLFHGLNYFICDCMINGPNQVYECTLKTFIISLFFRSPFTFPFFHLSYENICKMPLQFEYAMHGCYVGHLTLATTSFCKWIGK